MNGEFLENITSENLLGVTMNQNLSWEEHINDVVSQINCKLAALFTELSAGRG